MHQVPWSVLKDRIAKKSLAHQLTDLGSEYFIFVVEDGLPLFSRVTKGVGDEAEADIAANYVSTANKAIVAKNPDNRVMVHATPRVRGTFSQFIGAGDDQADQSKIGGDAGAELILHHEVGQSLSQTLYIDLNTITNESHAHAGWMMWKDALLDSVTLETVPKLSTYTSGTNTNFNLYGDLLIIPAAGDGTITPTSMVMVEIPLNEYGIRDAAGYWDATYNTTTKEFENITANLTGTGRFNMFVAEYVMHRFMNRVSMLGAGQLPMDTYDASQIGHNMRMKLTLKTRAPDHEWWWCGGLKPYRKRTA